MRLLIAAKNATIGIENGLIVEPLGRFSAEIRVPDGEIRPGLINAHDHLHRNHYGRLGRPPYPNAYAWAQDIQSRYRHEITLGRALPRRKALLTGAWKNLLAGVTHVMHHDPWEPDFDEDFPIHVVRIANEDSLGMAPDFVPPDGAAFALHVAEGIDRAAAEEVRRLAARGWLTRNLIAIHTVGADDDGVAKLRASGAAIVWCPTSNHFLFNRTAPEHLLAEGIDVLLGSDSLLTGVGTLLDELRIAHGVIADARLLDAVGPLAAKRLGLPVPSLAPGTPADLVLFRKPVLEASHEDVMLVMSAGQLRVLDTDLVAALDIDGGCMTQWRGVCRWTSHETGL